MAVAKQIVRNQLVAALETACRCVEDKMFLPSGNLAMLATFKQSLEAVESCRHARDTFAFEGIPVYAAEKTLQEAAYLQARIKEFIEGEQRLISDLEAISQEIELRRSQLAEDIEPKKKKDQLCLNI